MHLTIVSIGSFGLRNMTEGCGIAVPLTGQSDSRNLISRSGIHVWNCHFHKRAAVPQNRTPRLLVSGSLMT
jgi:hypothetical protein